MPKIPPKKNQFKPGQSGNPLGGRAHNPMKKKIKRLTNEEIADLGALLLAKDFDAIDRIAEERKDSALKVWTATLIVKSIKRGDTGAWSLLMDRMAGRVPQKVEADSKVQVTFTDFVKLASK